MLSACGGGNKENKDPLTGQEQTSEAATEGASLTEQADTNMTDEFDTLLGQPNDANGVIDYINTNISNASDMEVERYMTGLLGYGNSIRDIDFSRLEESRQYMPEDMVAFMELMKLEKESPSMTMSNEENRMTIGLTLSEMLERAVEGMLPHNRLGRATAKKLFVYAGPEHKHSAQKPESITI